MFWWVILPFHSVARPCPPDSPYYYDTKAEFSLNETEWHYFWTTILDHPHPIRISVWSTGAYTLYVGHKSECPDHNSSSLLHSPNRRSFLTADYSSDSQIQAFGLYAINATTVKLTIEDPFQIRRGLSLPMKVSIAGAIAAVAFLGYDLFRAKRRL
jgi:hypothetical protein